MSTVLSIPPLTDEQKQQVIDQTQSYINIAEQLFGVKTKKNLDIRFDLKGRAAGMYRVKQRFGIAKREIRYNTFIFSKYFSDNLETTVPHEVAHYISDLIYGMRNIRPHGQEWKNIMRAFDVEAKVTANYDLSGIPLRRQSYYLYQCDCREHQLSSIRHNKILKQRYQYHCNSCKQVLQFNQKQLASS